MDLVGRRGPGGSPVISAVQAQSHTLVLSTGDAVVLIVSNVIALAVGVALVIWLARKDS